MNWEKKGHIFKANGQYDWMNCYTTPLAAIVLDNVIRIYFSTRSLPDENGNFISNAGFIDVDKKDPSKVVYVHDKPLIPLGKPGHFDEFGVMVAKPVIHEEKIYMYYMGWQRLSNETVPYQVMLGLAISEDNGKTFTKATEGPVLGIDYIDPISIGNVSVMIEDGIWKMWYTTFTRWGVGGVKPTPEYNIKYAESKDGIRWEKTGIVAVDEDEKGGVATPSVIKIDDTYHMWFGYRPAFDTEGKIHGYKIGYASSSDGKHWIRNDEQSGIDCGIKSWDSEMVCYPHIVEVDGKYVMFYCGNGFGYEGFGYAELI